jgi:aminodeoxychorismate lyase
MSEAQNTPESFDPAASGPAIQAPVPSPLPAKSQVFFNGQFVPSEEAVVPVNDRSFMYGDGLFETIPVYNGRPVRWAQHLERMTRGAEFLKMRVPYTVKELRGFASQLIERNQMPNSLLRVTLSRGVGERGYSPKSAESPVLVMGLHEAPEVDLTNPPAWTLKTSEHKLPVVDPAGTYKTNNKLLQIIAKMEAEADGADDALMLNSNGEVAETASANLFWIYRGTVYTTPTGRGMLPGITRAIVLEICQAKNLPAGKRIIKPDALFNSEAIFLTLSSLGIVSVTSIDGQTVEDSPIVDQIRRAYWEAVVKS